MTRSHNIGAVLIMWSALAGLVHARPAAPPESSRSAPRVRLGDPIARFVLEQAILGARARLGRPRCLQVLTDFADQSGHSLTANIEASGATARDYLVERIWFSDGSEMPQCLKDPRVEAFTAAGYKVVYVCAARFAKLATAISYAELLVIHELLHTLGLGENPPSSREITRRVAARCG